MSISMSSYVRFLYAYGIYFVKIRVIYIYIYTILKKNKYIQNIVLQNIERKKGISIYFFVPNIALLLLFQSFF